MVTPPPPDAHFGETLTTPPACAIALVRDHDAAVGVALHAADVDVILVRPGLGELDAAVRGADHELDRRIAERHMGDSAARVDEPDSLAAFDLDGARLVFLACDRHLGF